MKVKSDHRSKFSNLSNWKEEAWKKPGLQRDSNPWPPRGHKSKELDENLATRVKNLTKILPKRPTFHFHHWSRGAWLEKPPNVHSGQGQAWRHCECTVHTRDTADKWAVEVRLLWRHYRHIKRDSESVGLFPEKKSVSTGYWPSVRSRWLDIGQVLFLRIYGPRRGRGP